MFVAERGGIVPLTSFVETWVPLMDDEYLTVDNAATAWSALLTAKAGGERLSLGHD